jgi:hypothetical protein
VAPWDVCINLRLFPVSAIEQHCHVAMVFDRFFMMANDPGLVKEVGRMSNLAVCGANDVILQLLQATQHRMSMCSLKDFQVKVNVSSNSAGGVNSLRLKAIRMAPATRVIIR